MNEEVWNIDRAVVCRRVIFEPLLDQLGSSYDTMKGGQWLRAAANSIAKDMLANKAIKIYDSYDIQHDYMRLEYVARVGTPNSWRILPREVKS